MSKTNVKKTSPNAYGNQIRELTAYEKLQRSAINCLLWEDTFYEDGVSIADRIKEYMGQVTPEQARSVLKEAKVDNKLRHMPLFLLVNMAKNGYLTAEDVANTITRVDDMSELLSLYWSTDWKDSTGHIVKNKHTVPKSIVKGIQKALPKFDEYQLAKYRGDRYDVSLKTVIKMTHPKPENAEMEALWGRAINGNLATPDTWEVGLTNCHTPDEKKEFWTRMLTEKTEKGFNKLGALALIRNLRNMQSVNVDEDNIRSAISSANMSKILPFQLVTAARYAPQLEDVLETKLLESIDSMEKLEGDTVVLLDTSGSMRSPLSNKSETTCQDVAAAMGAIIRGVCNKSIIYTFQEQTQVVPSGRKGFALIDCVRRAPSGGTSVIDCTNDAIRFYKESHNGKYPARVIIVTDEQTNSDGSGRSWRNGTTVKLDSLPNSCNGYIINVGTYENGVGYNNSCNYVHINGWSENVLKYISSYEQFKKERNR
jgi:hypothetical protein